MNYGQRFLKILYVLVTKKINTVIGNKLSKQQREHLEIKSSKLFFFNSVA